MMMTRRLAAVFLLCLLLAGCASGPDYDRDRYRQLATPTDAVAGFATWQHTSVLWGGVLIATHNLNEGTRIEVLSYPLRGNQLPDTSSASTGRFLAVTDDYLEPVDFTEGRLVTVAGVLTDKVAGKVGEVDTDYPSVRIEHIHLWPPGSANREPRVHFGVGFIFGG